MGHLQIGITYWPVGPYGPKIPIAVVTPFNVILNSKYPRSLLLISVLSCRWLIW